MLISPCHRQVLTLSGVARVFHSKRSILSSLADYQRAWALLLEFIQNAALNENNEVGVTSAYMEWT